MTTETQIEESRKVRFGVFEADLTTGELRRSGVKVRIQSQPFKLLAALLEHPGAVVTRETLQHLLWGSGTTVDFDHGLGIAMNKLREALGDSAENPRFVETLAKRGYRFIAPVQMVLPAGDTSVTPPTAETVSAVPASAPAHGVPYWPWIVAGMAAVSLALTAALLFRPTERKPYHIEQVTYSGQLLSNDIEVESFSSSAGDGTRLYFSHILNGTPELAVALAANGEITNFQLPPEIGAPLIGSLSPDGSRLIVHGHLQASPEQPLWIVPTLGGNSRKVPNLLAHDATWMPDGHHILIANGSELTIVAEDGSDAHHFLTVPGLAFWLRWSPDGKLLRFTLRDPKRQITELWEAAADGSKAHPFLPGWNQPASECCGSWTPDGKHFVFQSSRNNRSQIWEMREKPWLLKDRVPHQLTNGPLEFQAPSTTPGSQSVHFLGVDQQYALLKATPHSTGFTTLNQNLNSAALVAYSNDGTWVAWLNTADGSLWRSRADGSQRIELTTPPLRIFSMRWSPDNQQLALMAEEPGKPWKLYLLDAEGGKPVPLLHEERNEADPNWSADGKTLVFGRPPDRMDSERQPKAIYLYDLESHRVTEVAGSTGLFSPRLSPDGRWIAAIRLDQHALLLFDRKSGQWSTLTTHGVGDPYWSHDGQFIYFQDFLETGKPIYKIAVGSGKVEQAATISDLRPIAASDYRLIGLAPGDLPIVSARTSSVNLYSIDLNER
jgi:Tol biopolymer transport system component/DNA-binding winged helix-turn-helix (wHTH) protein